MVIAKKNKDWPKLLKFKVYYYQSIAHVSLILTLTHTVHYFPLCRSPTIKIVIHELQCVRRKVDIAHPTFCAV